MEPSWTSVCLPGSWMRITGVSPFGGAFPWTCGWGDRSRGPRPPTSSTPRPRSELARIFREYGEEPRARRLAREVVRRREDRPFETSDDLVAALARATGRPPHPRGHGQGLPGPSDRSEPGTLRPVRGPSEDQGHPEARGGPGRHLLPLPGRPDREEGLPGVEHRLCLSSRTPAVCLCDQVVLGARLFSETPTAHRVRDRPEPPGPERPASEPGGRRHEEAWPAPAGWPWPSRPSSPP